MTAYFKEGARTLEWVASKLPPDQRGLRGPAVFLVVVFLPIVVLQLYLSSVQGRYLLFIFSFACGVSVGLSCWILSTRVEMARRRLVAKLIMDSLEASRPPGPLVLLLSSSANRSDQAIVQGRIAIHTGHSVSSALAWAPLERLLEEVFLDRAEVVRLATASEPHFLEVRSTAIPTSSADWRSTFSKLLGNASVIIAVPGATPGFLWEAEEIITHGLEEKCLLIMPPSQERDGVDRYQVEQEWLMVGQFLRDLGVQLPQYSPQGAVCTLSSSERRASSVISPTEWTVPELRRALARTRCFSLLGSRMSAGGEFRPPAPPPDAPPVVSSP